MDVALVGLVLPGVENHSLAVLEQALDEAGYESRIVPYAGFPDLEHAIERIERDRPRVVGISLQNTESALACLMVARVLRGRGHGGRIVCGGHFATLNAADILRSKAGVDAVVRFAGEEALVALAGAAPDSDLSALPGIVFRGPDGAPKEGAPARVPSLGILRPPRRKGDLPEHLGFGAADMVLSRGCEHGCHYCCVAASSSLAHREGRRAGVDQPAYERRSVEAIAEEMASLHREHGARVFNFMDDNVLPTTPAEVTAWARELLDRLRRLQVPKVAISTKMRADAIDEDSARALFELGVVRAYVGIDGYTDDQLRTLGRRAEVDAGVRAPRLLAEQGIFPLCNALLIGPTMAYETVVGEIDGIARITHAPVHLLPIEVRPGTIYHAKAKRLGLVEGGLFLPHHRFLDERTQQLARVILSMPTRLSERSVPIGLYDMAYNLGIARRLVPELDLARGAAAFYRIAAQWNEDQVRLLRVAAEGAARGSDADIDAVIMREQPRVRAHDEALLAECDRWVLEVERAVARHHRKRIAAHWRGKLMGAVAVAASLSACAASHEEPRATPDAGSRMDGSAADGSSMDATVPDGAMADSGRGMDAAQDAQSGPCTGNTSLGDVFSCGTNVFYGTLCVQFDSQGHAVDVVAGEGVPDGGVDAQLKQQVLDMFTGMTYPSFANTSQPITAHCWLA